MGLALVVLSIVNGGFAPPGLSADVSAPMNAAYLFNSRNAALGAGMLTAALLASPEAIAATMIIRFILEIADRVVMSPLYPTVTLGNPLPPLIPALIELAIAVAMFRIVIKSRQP